MSQSSTSVCCVYCAKDSAKMMRCSRCMSASQQVVRYCSKECQKKDWSEAHKHFCGLTFPPKTSPGGNSVYGLLLPRAEDGDTPRVVEVPIKYHERIGALLPINMEKFMCYSEKEQRIGLSMNRSYMYVNPLKGGRPLPNMLVFTFRDMFLTDGSRPNRCVHRITGLNERSIPKPWNGPILVTKQYISMEYGYVSNVSDECPKDIQLSDGTDIVDFFRSYGAAGAPKTDEEKRAALANLIGEEYADKFQIMSLDASSKPKKK